MTSDDEKFFAWLDGELDAKEAAEMEARVAADPQLARLAQQHREFGSRLQNAFGAVAKAPVPKRLIDAARPPQWNVVDIAACRDAVARPFFGPLPQWAAMAAVLALGLFTGTFVGRDLVSSPVTVRDGGLYAAGAVEQALDTQLAGVPARDDLRIALTFRDQGGAICRSFTGAEASGLACRDGQRWRVRGLFAAPEGQESEYRMAAGMDPNLAALMDSTMAGEPFDAAQERAALQRGWR